MKKRLLNITDFSEINNLFWIALYARGKPEENDTTEI